MTEGTSSGSRRESRDLRTTLLGAAAWAGALLGLHVPRHRSAAVVAAVVLGGLVVACLATLVRRRRLVRDRTVADGPSTMLAGCLLTCAVLAGSAAVRVQVAEVSPLTGWAEERAVAEAVLVVTSDPVVREGRFGRYVLAETRLVSAQVRGRHVRSRVAVLVLGGPGWERVALGSTVRFTGRLGPA